MFGRKKSGLLEEEDGGGKFGLGLRKGTKGGRRLLDDDSTQDVVQYRPGDRLRAKLPKQQSHEMGTCQWIGIPDFLPGTGTWVGIELDNPLGTHNGTVNGKSYFCCKENHGVLVRIHQVAYETDPVSADDPYGVKSFTEMAVPDIVATDVKWVDKDGDNFIFQVQDGNLFYLLNGTRRPNIKKLEWNAGKGKGNDPGWLCMPEIGKQFALPRQGLPSLLGGLRWLAKEAGVECNIGLTVHIRKPKDAVDDEIQTSAEPSENGSRNASFNSAQAAGVGGGGGGGSDRAVSPPTLPALQSRGGPGNSSITGPPGPQLAGPTRTTGSGSGRNRAVPHPGPPVAAAAAAAAPGSSPAATPPSAPAAAAPPQWVAQLADMEARKAAAVAREDYAEAQRIKAEIDALRAAAAAAESRPPVAPAHADPAAARPGAVPPAGAGHKRGGDRSMGSLDFDDLSRDRVQAAKPVSKCTVPVAAMPVNAQLAVQQLSPQQRAPQGGSPAGEWQTGNSTPTMSPGMNPGATPVNTPQCVAPQYSQATVPSAGNISFTQMDTPAQRSQSSSPFPPPANTPTFGGSFAKPTVPDTGGTVQYAQPMQQLHGSPSDGPRGVPVPVNSPLHVPPQLAAGQQGWPGGAQQQFAISSGQFNSPPAAVAPPYTASPNSAAPVQQAAAAAPGAAAQPGQLLSFSPPPQEQGAQPGGKHKSQASLDFENFFSGK